MPLTDVRGSADSVCYRTATITKPLVWVIRQHFA
jgi:hypothetical protein